MLILFKKLADPNKVLQYVAFIGVFAVIQSTHFVYLFVWFDSLRPINKLSVQQGRVFLGWTSTKLG